MHDIEELRLKYQPERIRVLFVGESAPAGGAFFYKATGSVHAEFRRVLMPHLGGSGDFLSAFKEHGLYLDDLVLTPINYMTGTERRYQCEASIPLLARRLNQYKPSHIVSFMLGIRSYVDRAIATSGYNYPHTAIHFPGNGQQAKFRSAISDLIPVILDDSVVTPIAP